MKEIVINERENENLYLIFDIEDKDDVYNFDKQVNEKEIVRFIVYSLNNGYKKEINLSFIQNKNTCVSCDIRCLCHNGAYTNINICNSVLKEQTNTICEQRVQGIIMDANSKIKVIPQLRTNNNVTNSSHEVNIGYINPEHLFYLMSRGLTKGEATNVIVSGMFSIERKELIDSEEAKKLDAALKTVLN
ncbi:MAG: SufD family Fe-S cluster assembly protein [Mycoplasmataceae bacterium]|jgi:hypothetical protein|nr:SufD family Fe-S cluster assembly protein [Mycoplasmataceae bacterium]